MVGWLDLLPKRRPMITPGKGIVQLDYREGRSVLARLSGRQEQIRRRQVVDCPGDLLRRRRRGLYVLCQYDTRLGLIFRPEIHLLPPRRMCRGPVRWVDSDPKLVSSHLSLVCQG